MADATDRELPLAGVVLCCTSLLPEQRTHIVSVATEMGAEHHYDLTYEVTHLIVGDTNSEKYKFVAKERTDVKVLRPEFVEAVRASWVAGEDTSISHFEEQYRYPIFANLIVSITGFLDFSFRTHLQKTLTENGATFNKDLLKTATHLIADVPAGPKYEFAKSWGVKIVSLKWLEDSLLRGMILDESYYDPRIPTEEQGIGAWKAPDRAPTRKRNDKPQPSATQRARKLRRVTSVKLENQANDLWTDIVPKSRADREPVVTNNDDTVADNGEALGAADGADKRSSRDGQSGRNTRPNGNPPTHQDPSEPKGFWYGHRFFIDHFDRRQRRILEDHLNAHDAQIVASIDDLKSPARNDYPVLSNYVLTPFTLPRSQLPPTGLPSFAIEYVTDMWIEKCLHRKECVPPESHIAYSPFPAFPIPGFEQLIICSTGFSGVDLLHLARVVKLMGATYDEYLTSKASVLICATTTPHSEKMRHVNEWGIPAVLADWLWTSIQVATKLPYEDFLVKAPRKAGAADESTSVPAPGRKHRGASVSGSESRRVSKGVPSRVTSPAKPQAASTDKADLPPHSHGREKEGDTTTDPNRSAETTTSTNTAHHEDNDEAKNDPKPRRKKSFFSRALSNSSVLNKSGNGRSREMSRSNTFSGNTNENETAVAMGQPPRNATTEHSWLSQVHLNSMHAQAGHSSPPLDDTTTEKEDKQMTQLGYDDVDAAAMRAMVANGAHRDENTAEGPRELVVGKIEDDDFLNKMAPKRATRKSAKELGL